MRIRLLAHITFDGVALSIVVVWVSRQTGSVEGLTLLVQSLPKFQLSEMERLDQHDTAGLRQFQLE